MRFYRLSESRVKHVLHAPKRIEEGIASKTVAMMEPVSIVRSHITETVPSEAKQSRGASSQSRSSYKETWKQEIWVMVQDKGSVRKVISAWRYPGMTKPGTALPAEILREIQTGIVVSREDNSEKEKKKERMRTVLKKWRRIRA